MKHYNAQRTESPFVSVLNEHWNPACWYSKLIIYHHLHHNLSVILCNYAGVTRKICRSNNDEC